DPAIDVLDPLDQRDAVPQPRPGLAVGPVGVEAVDHADRLAGADLHRLVGLGHDHDRAGGDEDQRDERQDRQLVVLPDGFHHSPAGCWAARRRNSGSGRYGVTPSASTMVLSVLASTLSMVS